MNEFILNFSINLIIKVCMLVNFSHFDVYIHLSKLCTPCDISS